MVPPAPAPEPKPEPEPDVPATPTGLRVSLTGADFIEWSWNHAEGTGAQTSSEYEVEWAFWKDRIGARNAIRTVATRYRLPVEPATTAWLRVRSAENPTVAASDWLPAVEGSSLAARCVAPEITATRPRSVHPEYPRYLVRNEITIQRPAGTRRPLVRILRPYSIDHPHGLAARLHSWIATRDGGLVRDELTFDWPHARARGLLDGGGDAELLLEIVATGCAEAVTVRCKNRHCAVYR